jgi:uncharacterized protein with PQ loop repeat
MSPAELVGWGGAVVGTLTILAQAVRIRRVGVDGVNATTWSLFLCMSSFWFAYGLAIGSVEILVASVAGLPFFAWLLAMLEPRDRWLGLVRAAAAVGVVTWLPSALLGWNAGLLGIGVLVVATRMPQLVELVRVRHARGVSAGSWLLGSLSVVLWLGYYLGTARAAAAATMSAALVTNLTIVALAVVRHRGALADEASLPAELVVAVA